MIIIGLTGSIGMGKSTVGKMFEEFGTPVFDSDAAVHGLYESGGAAVRPVGQAFPGVVKDGAIDRVELSKRVVNDAFAMKRLEGIVHPLVQQVMAEFIQSRHDAGASFAVLDIPLLFEGRGRAGLDKVIVVSAPANIQRSRVLQRPGMSVEKFEALLARQLPDQEKRDRADFIIDTGGSFDDTRKQVRAVLDALRKQS